jgi:hypothetical protein
LEPIPGRGAPAYEFTLGRIAGWYLFGGMTMLMTIAVILLVLWLLGLVSSYTIGGLIHILLVVAIIIFLVRVIQGRRPVI